MSILYTLNLKNEKVYHPIVDESDDYFIVWLFDECRKQALVKSEHHLNRIVDYKYFNINRIMEIYNKFVIYNPCNPNSKEWFLWCSGFMFGLTFESLNYTEDLSPAMLEGFEFAQSEFVQNF